MSLPNQLFISIPQRSTRRKSWKPLPSWKRLQLWSLELSATSRPHSDRVPCATSGLSICRKNAVVVSTRTGKYANSSRSLISIRIQMCGLIGHIFYDEAILVPTRCLKFHVETTSAAFLLILNASKSACASRDCHSRWKYANPTTTKALRSSWESSKSSCEPNSRSRDRGGKFWWTWLEKWFSARKRTHIPWACSTSDEDRSLFFVFSSDELQPCFVHSSNPKRHASKKKAFTKASKKWTDDLGKKSIEDNFKKMIRYCKFIRVIAHSQVSLRDNFRSILVRWCFFLTIHKPFSTCARMYA